MKKKVLVRGPALTQSGYGEHCRYLLRALRGYEDVLDIYLLSINWGQTNWIYEDSDERRWIDSLIKKTIEYQTRNNNQAPYDMSIQVTIPNEWERYAPVNIGVTAGIETTKVAPSWIQKATLMDKIIVPSQHSKDVYENTSYSGTVEATGEKIEDFRCKTPVEVVNYPVKALEVKPVKLDLDYDFNFLMVAQWGPRKNVENTIAWFVEEFRNEEVGLVVKTNLMKNCILDRRHIKQRLDLLLSRRPADAKCKIYLLHGTMSEEEMNGLYTHPKIKSLVSLTHGEGYGLPLFEAAYNGLPVVATDWSGHVDFLYMPQKNKKGRAKNKHMFGRVSYELKDIPKSAVWKGVLQEGSQWAEPEKGSAKAKMSDVYKDPTRYKSQAKKLQKWILENFSEEKMCKKFVTTIFGEDMKTSMDADYIFVSDYFADQLSGGAEFSLQALIDKTDKEVYKINCAHVTDAFVEANKDKTWIFGNYTQLNAEAHDKIVESVKSYNVVEFDYKFCQYRNLELHKTLEGEECNCATKEHGKNTNKFLSAAKNVFFMSKKQMDVHLEHLDLDKDKCVILSSVFDDSFFERIKDLRKKYEGSKEDKWVISASPSWVKGAQEAQKWCKENEKEFIKLHGKSYEETLETLAKSKGLCFLPTGGDTCPRLVIEAKLLGCELETNDNVQHLNEKWFKTKNVTKIEDYLKEVPNRFWQRVANG